MQSRAPTFPLNAWCAAAWDREVRHALLPRAIGGKKLIFYRTLPGEAVALEDACWRRLPPLSMGKLRGDDLVCGYHGLAFNRQGRCVFMPSQETINPSAVVRAFPAAEKHRFVWVRLGDPALAGPDKAQAPHWNHDPEWAGDGKVIHVECDYRLVIDNLMDLTHEAFVHSSSIGNDAVAEAPFEATHGDRTATVTRWMRNIDPPPFWAGQLGKPGKADRWRIIRFEAPATIAIDVGVNGCVLNTITPETATSRHYFWAFPRNYRLDEQRLTTEPRDGVARIFGEDEAVLEARRRAIEEHPDHAFYNLNIDAGAMWARRLIDKMIAAEQAARPLPARRVKGPISP